MSLSVTGVHVRHDADVVEHDVPGGTAILQHMGEGFPTIRVYVILEGDSRSVDDLLRWIRDAQVSHVVVRAHDVEWLSVRVKGQEMEWLRVPGHA